MSVQNDNTLVTKGDLKELYTDKIAPYLGGGINYYYTDRTGEELKVGEYSLSGSLPDSTSQNTKLNISSYSIYGGDTKRADFLLDNNTIVIPEGMTVKLSAELYLTPGDTKEVNTEIRFKDYLNNIDLDYITTTYFGAGYSRSGTWSTIFTAPTGGAKIGLRCTYCNGTKTISSNSRVIAEEIGRIVDPVKYVSNNSDLQETPVGNIISYMGNSVPKHYLACDGTVYNIGSYPELEAFIINEFGSINYFGGDGSITWAVPDLRGEFLRGTGTNSHTNQGNGANVGTHQNSTEIPYLWLSGGNKLYGRSDGTVKDHNARNYDTATCPDGGTSFKNFSATTTESTTTAVATHYTTRPTNTSVKYCIKYESTYHAFFSNAAYKVEASFGLTYNSTIQSYTSYSMVYIAGDTSMMDANHFVAPMDGWYSVSFKSSQLDYTKPTIQYIQINDVTSNAFVDGTGSGTSHSHFGINMTQTLYLNKGDKVNYRVWTNGNTISLPAVRSASFCLLTSNYKENIIAGGEVYSTDEQEIGTWTDGKKLYQKTIAVTSQPTINTWGSGYEIGASVDTIVKVTGRLVLDNNAGTYVGNTTWPITTDDDYINYIGTDNRHPSLPNRVGVKVGKQGYTSRPVTITVQYTKTTDTANQYTYKNSLLLTRPDLWDVGVEYDFGGGLYGKRLTGNLSVTTTLTAYAIDATWKNKSYTPVSSGGWISRGVMLNACNGTLVYMLYKNDSQGLCIQAKDSAQTVSYDIWVTYRKA